MGPNRQKRPDNRRRQRGGHGGVPGKAAPASPTPASMMARDDRDMIIDVLHHAASRGAVPVPETYFNGPDKRTHVVTLQRNTRLAPRDVLQRVFEGLGFPQDLVTQYLADVLHKGGTFPSFVQVEDLLGQDNASNQSFVVNACFDLFRCMTCFESRLNDLDVMDSVDGAEDEEDVLTDEMETVRLLFGDSLVELRHLPNADQSAAATTTAATRVTQPHIDQNAIHTDVKEEEESEADEASLGSDATRPDAEACFRFTTCDEVEILVVIRVPQRYPRELPIIYLQPFRTHTVSKSRAGNDAHVGNQRDVHDTHDTTHCTNSPSTLIHSVKDLNNNISYNTNNNNNNSSSTIHVHVPSEKDANNLRHTEDNDNTLVSSCYPLQVYASDAHYLDAATRRLILDDAVHVLHELRGGPSLVPLLSALHGRLTSLSMRSGGRTAEEAAAAAAEAAAAQQLAKARQSARLAQRRAFMEVLTSHDPHASAETASSCTPHTHDTGNDSVNNNNSNNNNSVRVAHRDGIDTMQSVSAAHSEAAAAAAAAESSCNARNEFNAAHETHPSDCHVSRTHGSTECEQMISSAPDTNASSPPKDDKVTKQTKTTTHASLDATKVMHDRAHLDEEAHKEYDPFAAPLFFDRVVMHVVDETPYTAQTHNYSHEAKLTECPDDTFFPSAPLRRDTAVDAALHREWNRLRQGGRLTALRRQLPAYAIRPELQQLLAQHAVIVLGGDTGSGKTTQIPQYLYEFMCEAHTGSRAHILCTQPRRLAATSVAIRVAEEREEAVGGTVGYSIRLERCVSRRTRITYCTTGMVLRQLQRDRDLAAVSHIVVDEIHERGVDTDFLLILLRDLLPRRPDLKVVLMSATMDSALFARYFGGAPVLAVSGRTFPVRVMYLEEIIPAVHYIAEDVAGGGGQNGKSGGGGGGGGRCRRNTRRAGASLWADEMEPEEDEVDDRRTQHSSNNGNHSNRNDNMQLSAVTNTQSGISESPHALPPPPPSTAAHTDPHTQEVIDAMNMSLIPYELIECIVVYIEKELRTDGAVLIFMPGMAEIMRCLDQLRSNSFLASRCVFYNLHSSLGSAEQQKVFERAPRGTRKVVIGTNIMETSITIDDAVYVIDSGKAKENRYHASRALSELATVNVSRSNCRQRAGRAGRVRAGLCFRLFTEAQFNEREEHALCEMHRVPLESLVLHIYALRLGDEVDYLSRALSPPEERAIRSSVSALTALGALTREKRLTSLGQHLSTLPLDVRIGKMIIHGALLQCVDPVLTMAACLSIRSPFVSVVERRAEVERVRRAFAGGVGSDPLAAYAAYQLWLARMTRGGGPAAARRLCEECFLSVAVMQQIQSTKKQYERHLCDAGFLDMDDTDNANTDSSRKKAVSARVTRAAHANHFLFPMYTSLEDKVYEAGGEHFNAHSGQISCILACLVAGLYPNVARTATRPSPPPRRKYGVRVTPHDKPPRGRDTFLVTWDGIKCQVHPSSVVDTPIAHPHSRTCGSAAGIHTNSVHSSSSRAHVPLPPPHTSQLLVYVDKIRTSAIYLREVSLVTPMHVILFGGGALRYDEHYGELCVDDATAFRCSREEATLLIHIKTQLDAALTRKINDPSQSWESVSRVVVRAIVKLLLAEDARHGAAAASFAVVDRRQPRAPVTAPLLTAPEATSSCAQPVTQTFVTGKCCFVCGECGHVAQHCPHGPQRGVGAGTPSVRCFICGQWHYPQDCSVPLPIPSSLK